MFTFIIVFNYKNLIENLLPSTPLYLFFSKCRKSENAKVWCELPVTHFFRLDGV